MHRLIVTLNFNPDRSEVEPMLNKLRQIYLSLVLGLAALLPASAQVPAELFTAELLPGWRTESGSHMAAIRLNLSQGWKTYWRSPGEAGIPPEFNWQGSENIQSVEIHWPTPQVFHFNGMQSIGYARELVLPVEIWPARKGQPMTLATEMTLGVCRDVCVQAQVGLNGLLPATGATDPAIRAAIRAQPMAGRQAGVAATRCSVSPSRRGLTLVTEIDVPRLGRDEVVVVETSNPAVWASDSTTRREGKRLISETSLISTDRQPIALDRSGLTITLLADGRAVEIHGCTGA